MIEITDDRSIIEYYYLLNNNPDLLRSDILVNPENKDINGKVVIFNSLCQGNNRGRPKQVIKRSEEPYNPRPNHLIMPSYIRELSQERLFNREESILWVNCNKVPNYQFKYDCYYYLQYQLGMIEESKKLLGYKMYQYLKLTKIDIYNFRQAE